MLAAFIALALALGGCSIFGERPPAKGVTPAQPPQTIVSENTVRQTTPSLPAFAKNIDTNISGGRVGVNTFLWRGALDTVSFMPLLSADPFGGVIITDWYAPPETPQERFKLTVYILGRELRADAIRVAVFHQKQVDGQWQNVPTEKATADQLEDTILSRAQQLRSQALGTSGGS